MEENETGAMLLFNRAERKANQIDDPKLRELAFYTLSISLAKADLPLDETAFFLLGIERAPRIPYERRSIDQENR